MLIFRQKQVLRLDLEEVSRISGTPITLPLATALTFFAFLELVEQLF